MIPTQPTDASAIAAAQIVLPCAELSSTLAFFAALGFRVDAIHPADDPRVAVISGHGVCLRLDRDAVGAPGVLRLLCRDPAAVSGDAGALVAPNGTRIELAAVDPPLILPPSRPSFVLCKMGEGAGWVEGRAGMRYRDLIPDRQGGRFIASHIEIAAGGPVPDYVHFHKVAFQMIYCAQGWVRVVYEDQGPPFVLRAGDCVLQPPRIRHRVLESSAGLEVVEIGTPADHETFADHAMALPTPQIRADRNFDGQRFVRHQASAAVWRPWRSEGFEARDLGIADATFGLADVRVVRASGGTEVDVSARAADLLFTFVLNGEVTLACEGQGRQRLGPGDAFVVPPALPYALGEASPSMELLEVLVHPRAERTPA